MPALIYAIYAATHVVIDLYRGLYNTAFTELLVGIMFTLTLNIFGVRGFTFISWIVISIPFLLMSTVAGVLMFVFGLNPATGRALYSTVPPPKPKDATPLVPQPLPPVKPAPAPSQASEPSPYSMPVAVHIESFFTRPVSSNR